MLKRRCYYCKNKIEHVDYKDVQTLKQFLSGHAKIQPRHRTGLCSKHQRWVSRALKRARQMALLPYVTR